MPRVFASLTILLLLGMTLSRALILKRKGIQVMNFAKIDKKDFLILPFALFYFYIVFSNTFRNSTVTNKESFNSSVLSWAGVFFCVAGLLLMLGSLVSFGKSFRIGIDIDSPDELVTTGVFAFSRNPIYVAFGLVLLGQFLIFPSWILLVYLAAAIWLFHRQVMREEDFLKQYYGEEFFEYSKRVRRYF